eukprot:TRINITY_DN26754_c0_g1_i1.p1 TRINITY_DN26754_c0_g1~~TRINITY_DN26754_c0_g1_i1.p1  ORF type:complete len:439 (-),score=68.27 TRINITY_DN26754_c0_g1_i1:21-1250(-)
MVALFGFFSLRKNDNTPDQFTLVQENEITQPSDDEPEEYYKGDTGDVREVYSCEEENMIFFCDHSFIDILEVQFGRRPNNTDEHCTAPEDHSYSCQDGFQNNCTDTLKFTCNGRSLCTFNTNFRTFGVDPCSQQKKAAYFKYRCIAKKKIFHPPLVESVALMMVEATRRPGISEAAMSAMENLNPSWPLYVWYPPASKDPGYLDMLLELPFVAFAKKQKRTIFFVEFGEEFFGRSQNYIAFSKAFWSRMKEDKFLFIHSDSAYCHPQKDFPYTIEDFLYFDYVGAPWGGPRSFLDSTVFVGNGGFSIRKKELMIKCIDFAVDSGYEIPMIEDYWFAYCNTKFGKFAGWELARHFAIETVDPLEIGALGIHGVCSYRRDKGCDKNWVAHWLSRCPSSAFLFSDGRCNGCE